MHTQEDILDFIISEEKDLLIPAEVERSNTFQDYKKIWDLCDVLADSERSPDLDDAWTSISTWMQSEDSRPVVSETPSTSKKNLGRVVLMRSERWAIAASFLLVVGSVLYLLRPQDPFTTIVASSTESTITLPDGSSVEVSPNAQIKFLTEEAFVAGDDRVVYLEGEAVFDVVKDASKPFKVVTGETSVGVLGTVFRYKAEGEYSESENLEGQVNFSVNADPDVAQILNPGDKASYEGDGIKFTPAPPPPPPPTPRNKVVILDIVDILTDRFATTLELSPSFLGKNVVVEVDLRGDLASIISDLQGNENVQIEVQNVSQKGHYVIHKLSGNDLNLQVDYTYDHYVAGLPLEGADQ